MQGASERAQQYNFSQFRWTPSHRHCFCATSAATIAAIDDEDNDDDNDGSGAIAAAVVAQSYPFKIGIIFKKKSSLGALLYFRQSFKGIFRFLA